MGHHCNFGYKREIKQIRRWPNVNYRYKYNYNDVMMGAIASQITSLTIVYSIVYSDADQTKLRVTCICKGNSPGTGEFPAQMASNTENVFIWWRHHGVALLCLPTLIVTIPFMRYLPDFVV